MGRPDIPAYLGHRVDVSTFWGNIHDASGGLRFPTIGKLTKSLLSIPHSNADVEKFFSHVNLIKVKQKNQLKTSPLDALLMVKQGLPCESCVEFSPGLDMCRCINMSMYLIGSSNSD